jgi:hypothetical protein
MRSRCEIRREEVATSRADQPASPSRSPSKLLVAAPLLAMMAFVLSIYIDRGQVLESLPRPLGVAAAAIVAVQVIGIAVTRSVSAGTAIALLVIVGLVDPRIVVFIGLMWVIGRELSRRRGWSFSWHAIRLPIAVLFVATIARLAVSPAFAPGDLIPQVSGVRASGHPAGPDIFLIMLDGYPRSDTLASFGYDNNWFESELAERGFSIARNSHTNYDYTYSVLPTMLHMRHAHEIDEMRQAPDGWAAQRRAMRAAIASAPAFSLLEQAGYATISAGADASPLSLSPVASYLAEGRLTQFERELLDITVVGRWFPELALGQYRERVLDAFEATERVASDPRTTFMFTHVLSPHAPVVFDRDGNLPPHCQEPCNPYTIHASQSGLTGEQFHRAQTDQIHYLNGRVLVMLDQVIAKSPNAPIVLFSDHGMRSDFDHSAEWFASFFASRTPGHDLFDEDARPIEILPVIFNAYLGHDHPIPADETYYSPLRGQRPLFLEPWPDGN